MVVPRNGSSSIAAALEEARSELSAKTQQMLDDRARRTDAEVKLDALYAKCEHSERELERVREQSGVQQEQLFEAGRQVQELTIRQIAIRVCCLASAERAKNLATHDLRRGLQHPGVGRTAGRRKRGYRAPRADGDPRRSASTTHLGERD